MLCSYMYQTSCQPTAINANLGREVKAGDLTKEDSPWWGTFDYRQVPGRGGRN